MPEVFHMRIRDLFLIRNGRTVLAGAIEEGERAVVLAGAATVSVDGRTVATVQLEGEMIASRPYPKQRLEVRAVSTRESTGLTKEIVDTHECRLEGPMRYSGHRHMIGLESPPIDYVADDMTLGPRLPEGWDGDAWMKPQESGYFLRAWNKAEGRYAVASADKYEEARTILLEKIAHGGAKVEIRVTETRENG